MSQPINRVTVTTVLQDWVQVLFAPSEHGYRNGASCSPWDSNTDVVYVVRVPKGAGKPATTPWLDGNQAGVFYRGNAGDNGFAMGQLGGSNVDFWVCAKGGSAGQNIEFWEEA